jgi:hypothetical protein
VIGIKQNSGFIKRILLLKTTAYETENEAANHPQNGFPNGYGESLSASKVY